MSKAIRCTRKVCRGRLPNPGCDRQGLDGSETTSHSRYIYICMSTLSPSSLEMNMGHGISPTDGGEEAGGTFTVGTPPPRSRSGLVSPMRVEPRSSQTEGSPHRRVCCVSKLCWSIPSRVVAESSSLHIPALARWREEGQDLRGQKGKGCVWTMAWMQRHTSIAGQNLVA